MSVFSAKKFNDLHIYGEVYPPTPTGQLVSSLTSAVWYAGLAFIFGGDALISALGIKEDPVFYSFIKRNKIVVGGALFLMNNLGSSLLATGAFEVYYNGELIYSK